MQHPFVRRTYSRLRRHPLRSRLLLIYNTIAVQLLRELKISENVCRDASRGFGCLLCCPFPLMPLPRLLPTTRCLQLAFAMSCFGEWGWGKVIRMCAACIIGWVALVNMCCCCRRTMPHAPAGVGKDVCGRAPTHPRLGPGLLQVGLRWVVWHWSKSHAIPPPFHPSLDHVPAVQPR